MANFLNPILVILKSKEDGKYYPAIASELPTGLGFNEKFAHLFRGKISTYLKTGFDTMADAKRNIEDVLIQETSIDRTCTDTVIEWDGKGHPQMQIHIEEIEGVHRLVS